MPGLTSAVETAFGAVRDDGMPSRVGGRQPTDDENGFGVFLRNSVFTGGVGRPDANIRELMPGVLAGVMKSGRAFDYTTDLGGYTTATASWRTQRPNVLSKP